MNRRYLVLRRLWLFLFFLKAVPLVAGGVTVVPRPTTPVPDDAPLVSYAGYIKSEFFYDTRQVFGFRDDQFLLSPEAKLTDSCGADINAVGQLHTVAFESRMAAKIRGPQVCGAKTFGLLEGDFLGVSDPTVHLFRLRHAFFQLDWDFIKILCGQYNNPILVDECTPLTISFNSGAPMESFARSPQARMTLKLSDHVSFIGSIAGEVDAESQGPLGVSSSYIRNGQTPLLHAQIKMAIREKYYAGIGVDFRSLRPRIVTDKNVNVDERVDAISAIAYAAVDFKRLRLKVKGIYAENADGYLMLGGFGITGVDPATDGRTYKPLRVVSGWFDGEWGPYEAGCGAVKVGLFAGATKNLGVSTCLVPFTSISGAKSFKDVVYGDITTVDWLARVSPRLMYVMKAVEFAGEVEVTHARFGTICSSGKVAVNDPETNVRILLAGYYRF